MGGEEAQFVDSVIEYAQWHGWRCAHFRPAMTKHGWRTAVQGDGRGFPDLFILRGKRRILAECKSEKGTLTDEQAEWLAAGEKAGFETHVWRPQDWDEIEEVLK